MNVRFGEQNDQKEHIRRKVLLYLRRRTKSKNNTL